MVQQVLLTWVGYGTVGIVGLNRIWYSRYC